MFCLQLWCKLSRDPHRNCPELIWASAATAHQLAHRISCEYGPLSSQYLSLEPGIAVQGVKVFLQEFCNSSLFWLPVVLCPSAVSSPASSEQAGTGNNFKNCSYCCSFSFLPFVQDDFWSCNSGNCALNLPLCLWQMDTCILHSLYFKRGTGNEQSSSLWKRKICRLRNKCRDGMWRLRRSFLIYVTF